MPELLNCPNCKTNLNVLIFEGNQIVCRCDVCELTATPAATETEATYQWNWMVEKMEEQVANNK